MTTTAAVFKSKDQKLLVAFSRVSLYLLILLVSQISFILQKSFINWSLVAPFYLVICLALSLHVFYVHFVDWFFERRFLHFSTFILDALFLSFLIALSGLNQSLFLFLHLVNILLSGLVFQSRGALAAALFSSIFFTIASFFGPELKAMNYIFLLVLNNIAFFSVAGLSGYLSEQLQFMGVELTRTGLSLKEIQELNKAIVSHMPSGLVTFDRNGLVFQGNLSAQNIFGTGDLKGANIFQILPELRNPSVERQDVVWRKASEENKILQISVASVYSPVIEGELCIAQIEDLTPVRRLEYSVRQNEKMAAIGGLAAGIAHEIRNPLASISGSVEMLNQTTSNDDDRKLMRIILKEISRLNNLITEFLDYSSPEKPPSDPVDLVSLVKEVLDGLKMDNKLRQDVLLKVHLPEKAVILGRRDKLKQAFLNIVINAYQAMEDVSSPHFEMIVLYSENKWTVQFRDSGRGMSEATRRRMFEPFHTTKSKGTGLGLAVTHKILEGHGAEIFVESQIDVGTTFTLKFPAVSS
ncbi:MAG: PAS domain-containing sensor histidine kinase [Bdellovibrionaceae bacterium]|nr:PAS domain-containing sensor histidine kinase [Pseudobdellovibrionaceae bacterium]